MKRNVISACIFLKMKYKPEGSEDKLKARLVAGEHQQAKVIYRDVSSPTANKISFQRNCFSCS